MNGFAIRNILSKCQTMPYLWRPYEDYILHTICKPIRFSWPWLGGKWVFVAEMDERWSSYSSKSIVWQLSLLQLACMGVKILRNFVTQFYLFIYFIFGAWCICIRHTHTRFSGSNSINCQAQSGLSNPSYCLLSFIPF